MTNKNQEPLTHHEELRYSYLLKNLHYLNEREKLEFNYLLQKKNAAKQASPRQASQESYSPPQKESTLSVYPNPATRRQENEWYSQSPANVGENGLPEYPRQARTSQQTSAVKRQAKKKVPKPKKKRSKKGFKRVLKWAGLLLLVLMAGMLFMFFKGRSDVTSSKGNYSPAVKEKFSGKDAKDGTNILVLGSDQRVTEQSTDARTDTIMVVNVGNKDHKVKMVSFMRDTLVNIPGYSAGDGYYDLKLNTAFNLGEQDGHRGADYIRQTLKRHFDIDIKYYVMVDFETFAEAINTLFPKGVKINAKFGLVSGQSVDSVQVPDDLNMKDGIVPEQTIKVGEQYMDGRTLLNYARFRKDDDGDFGRTKRQQQVMKAIVSQIKDPTKLFTGSAAIGKVFALTSTNLSYSFLLTKGISIASDAKNGIQQLTIPQEGDWVDDYDQYGGMALYIDFAKYKKSLKQMGLR